MQHSLDATVLLQQADFEPMKSMTWPFLSHRDEAVSYVIGKRNPTAIVS